MVTGRQIGGYQILEELGRGAMGVVFKARQVSMDRIVAIKFLPKKLAQDERIVARFLREARAAGQLAHPNIVSVHELGVAEGMHFIAMEYVDGNSIQKKLKEKGPFTEKETLEIAGQIAEGLKLAHSRGVLHRDIKPDNFLIDSMGRVRLADLGLASIESNRDGGLTQDGTTLGTPHYMSPEQCSGTNVDGRSDLYSLGASMFVMATGQTPYEGTTAAAVMVKVLTEAPQSIKKVRPELSAGFVALIEKLMQKDPSKRFQNAQAAAEAIQLCKSGQYKPVLGPKPAAQLRAPAGKAQAASAAQTEKQITRLVKQDDSKLLPLMLGAAAAIALLVILALFKGSGGAQPANSLHPATTSAPATHLTATNETPPPSPTVVYRVPGESKSPDVDINRNPLLARKMKELKALEDDFRNNKIKPAEAMRRLNVFRKDHGDLLSYAPGPRLERELRMKLNAIGDEWKKLEPQVNDDLKFARMNDALTKLCDFLAANDGTDEAVLALARIEPLCEGRLSAAATVSAYNPKEAVAMLSAITAKLPEKLDAQFKKSIADFNRLFEIQQELAELYDRAVKKALYFDPVSKTCFQFGDAAKVFTESRLKFDVSKKDAQSMADLFNAADNIYAALRAQVNAKPADVPKLRTYSNVKVTRWDDGGLVFVTAEVPEPQSLKWDSDGAPDVLLRLAKELRKADLDKPAGQWDVGVLAFAVGIKAEASKCLRDASAKDEVLKAAAGAALKLLKSAEAVAVKPVEPVKPEKFDSPPVAPLVTVSNGDEESRQLLKDLQDAQKAGSREKIKALRADLDLKYVMTDYVKAHKKEIDDLIAALDALKPADKPKVDTMTPEEREAHEMLKKAGWTDIVGNWVWDKDKQAFRVEGLAELVNPALECDVNVSFKMLESTSKLRVLARVDKAVVDRFATFGAAAGLGFGADITSKSAYVYLDWLVKKGAVKDPMKYGEVRLDNRPFNNINLSVRKTITVTIDMRENKSAGDARTTGDTRVIVSGPVLIVPTISNAK